VLLVLAQQLLELVQVQVQVLQPAGVEAVAAAPYFFLFQPAVAEDLPAVVVGHLEVAHPGWPYLYLLIALLLAPFLD